MTLPLTAVGFESPSLGSPGSAGPAYELKFLLDEAQAAQVENWARRRLVLDPHGEAALGGAYRTTSLCCDTPKRDVYQRTGICQGHKFRVRCYGAMPWVFLERKSKAGDRVAKRRLAIPVEELALLARPLSPRSWPGHWFHRSLLSYGLHPACLITYRRTAFGGSCVGGPLRLTLDRHLQGSPVDAWRVTPAEGGRLLLPGQVILELKFRSALPSAFRGLIRDLGLSRSRVSKYRLCREAWGQPAEGGSGLRISRQGMRCLS